MRMVYVKAVRMLGVVPAIATQEDQVAIMMVIAKCSMARAQQTALMIVRPVSV
jgi:hypothetical protein